MAMKARDELSIETGRQPRITELAEYMKMPECEVSEALCASMQPLSLTSPEEGEQLDIPFDDSERIIELLDLKNALGSLTDEEKELIALRFFHGLTQSQTARLLGTGQVSVSRKERKILNKLRKL